MMVDKIHRKNPGPRRGDPNEAISRKLKLLYTSVEEEGIPDRFLDLLEKLDLAERATSGASDPRDDR
ncbi:hypothetical protein KL86APRO_12591 [uncultured Alphaproteobacteria bacterium]|uniref:Anti-sigma factor NepR domain-containing protein n=1 Tax=uncultured Alphaproteobacteria bacterium TaxID=91750 RepID=A0A212KCM3_9PROT|nr:hypothetical protein KL86APRO_12591 [uncultured Alphaproteobacteria bacterium]